MSEDNFYIFSFNRLVDRRRQDKTPKKKVIDLPTIFRIPVKYGVNRMITAGASSPFKIGMNARTLVQ